jgi:hypothetical protein
VQLKHKRQEGFQTRNQSIPQDQHQLQDPGPQSNLQICLHRLLQIHRIGDPRMPNQLLLQETRAAPHPAMLNSLPGQVKEIQEPPIHCHQFPAPHLQAQITGPGLPCSVNMGKRALASKGGALPHHLQLTEISLTWTNSVGGTA